jgi:flagellar hook-associated protein 2
VIEKVNSSGAGVTMSYDESSDKVTLRSDGIDAITVGSPNDTSNLLVALNLTNSDTTTKTIGTEGQRAIVEVDGHTYVRDTNEVDDIINGVTLTLNSVDSAPTTINVQIDTEKAVDAFATFVSHYNKLMEMLAVPEYDEDDKEYMEYLTDTDKESMSDSEIEDYMEKYELYNKYDIIRRSSELRNMDNTLREIFFGIRPNVTGSINDISDIGIEIAGAGDLDTENYGYIIELTTDKDELIELLNDNDDFMDALMNNSDSVFEFFGKNSDIELDEDNDGEIDAGKSQQQYDDDLGWSRYFTQMIRDRYTNFDGMIGGKLGNTGTIYTELTRLEKRITTQEDRVDKQLERYWAQFTAMEKAIADAQAASADFTNASG